MNGIIKKQTKKLIALEFKKENIRCCKCRNYATSIINTKGFCPRHQKEFRMLKNKPRQEEDALKYKNWKKENGKSKD